MPQCLSASTRRARRRPNRSNRRRHRRNRLALAIDHSLSVARGALALKHYILARFWYARLSLIVTGHLKRSKAGALLTSQIKGTRISAASPRHTKSVGIRLSPMGHACRALMQIFSHMPPAPAPRSSLEIYFTTYQLSEIKFREWSHFTPRAAALGLKFGNNGRWRLALAPNGHAATYFLLAKMRAS